VAREVRQVHVGDWLGIRFTGQIVEVAAVDGLSAIVLRADGSHDAFSLSRHSLIPLGDSVRQALDTLFAEAMLAAFRGTGVDWRDRGRRIETGREVRER